MSQKEAFSVEHRLDKLHGLVYLGIAGVTVFQSIMLSEPYPETAELALLVSALAFIGFVVNLLETNRYALPVLRAFGKEQWSYYYQPPEDRV